MTIRLWAWLVRNVHWFIPKVYLGPGQYVHPTRRSTENSEISLKKFDIRSATYVL